MSQSLIKALIDAERCPRATYYQYIQRIDAPPTDAMFKGLYFEYHVLGNVRSGVEPVFQPLKRGRAVGLDVDTRPVAQVELDELIITAQNLLQAAAINIPEGQVQVHLQTDQDDGHLDLIAPDFKNPVRTALYDVKYTETALDDRWRGWANFEDNFNDHLQALHYITLYHTLHGVWPPFYFLLFGKAGWVRFIKVEVTEAGLARYKSTRAYAFERLEKFKAAGWPPAPDYNKCRTCPYNNICTERADIPAVETFEI